MSSETLHKSLLRPAIIHVLRAAGFHATKPSVLESLVDICTRYMTLIVSQTASFAYDRTLYSIHELVDDLKEEEKVTDAIVTPTATDVRNALVSAAFFSHGLSASEEIWTELMRKPLADYPPAAREHERRRRDLEDTEDVREFIDWVTGPASKETRRIAGVLKNEAQSSPPPNDTIPYQTPASNRKDNYLDILKKKQSKSGDSARYNGTILGRNPEDGKQRRVEGGPVNFIEWKSGVKRKRDEAGG